MTDPTQPSPAKPPQSNGPPLAAFAIPGTPSVISYQTPESVSYSGQHVLEIDDYGLADFAGVAGPPAGSSAAAPASPGAPSTDIPAAASPTLPLAAAITVPSAVVISDSSTAEALVITLAPFPLAPRLATLTWADVEAAAAAQRRVEIYRSAGGQLDYRVRDVSEASAPVVPQTGMSYKVAVADAVMQPAGNSSGPATAHIATSELGVVPNGGGGGGGSGSGSSQYIELDIIAPQNAAPLSGPASGLVIPVSCTLNAVGVGAASLLVQLEDETGRAVGKPVQAVPPLDGSLTGSPWVAKVPVAQSGSWRLAANAASDVGVTAFTYVAIYVTLASGPPGTPVPAPLVTITSPARNTVIAAPDGIALATVTGTADTGGGSPVSVSLSVDAGPAQTVDLAPNGGTSATFSTTVRLTGEGFHLITATGINQEKVAAPSFTVQVMLAASLPFQPLDRRLLLIEKISITSFLGEFGAGRLVKTFSLLPGEQTVISVDTYTKHDASARAASSILDSTATEAAADFQDTVNMENDRKATSSDASSASISADVGANWGWGHASVRGQSTTTANAAREDMTKTVTGSVAKHTSKASSNRTVSVNTEFTATSSAGTTTDTTRTLKNINVSRVLNFVFRQMTQQHTVFVHLTDATLGYYALDLLLDAQGNPQLGPGNNPVTRETFTEYAIPEIASFAQTAMSSPAAGQLSRNILKVLSTIPDWTGTQQSLVEIVTPKSPTGQPQPGAKYLRVRPELTQSYPATGPAQFTVPGIILAVSTSVLRTDQLLCDALLGEGVALDGYSQALQDVAIAQSRAAIEAQQAATAKERLAQSIVASKDSDQAALWEKVFPQPLSVPATVTVPATAGYGPAAG